MAMEVSTGSMMSSCESKELNHLGLVAGMYDELGIGTSIDALIPQDMQQRKVSIGKVLKAMVLNGLGFVNQRLYNIPHFFESKPVEQLLGEGVEAAHFNDDVTGRMLDTIYEAGVSETYAAIAINALKTLNLPCHMSHIDTTTFHTDGKYNQAEEDGVIKITKGYSRDHRPELNQFGLKLIVEGQAGIPMMMAALSGNDNDKTRFKQAIKDHIGQLQDDFSVQHIVGDSALYSVETIKLMTHIIWTTRVPETIGLARDYIEKYADQLAADNDGLKLNYQCVDESYAGVEQKWLVVYSPQAHERAKHNVSKQFSKKSQDDQKLLKTFCNRSFACEKDASHELELLKKKLAVTNVHDEVIVPIAGFNGRGRPAKGAAPDFYTYHVHLVSSSNYQQYQQRLQRKSCFIIATNQTDMGVFDADEILAGYKNQQKVERGFRFLKDPMFLASSVFLKSPKRIMALTMVMTVCLLVYAALEYRMRKSLHDNHETFPNQIGKMVEKPTIRWVFQYFQNIQILYIQQVKPCVLNLNKEHEKLLKLMGESYQKIYS
jgi:transposase